MSKDYGYAFEEIVSELLFKGSDVKFANYFGTGFETKALLFATCVSQLDKNKKSYNQDEIDKIISFKDKLENDNNGDVIYSCIDFFAGILSKRRTH